MTTLLETTETSTTAIYRQTLALNPTDARTYYKLGLSLVAAGQVQEGIEAFQQSLTFNANDPEVYRSLGEALCCQGHYHPAMLAYRQAIALNPNLTEIYRLFAIALAKQGQSVFFPTLSYAAPDREPMGETTVPAAHIPIEFPAAPVRRPLGIPLWLWLGGTGIAAIATLSIVFSNSWSVFHSFKPPSPQPPSTTTVSPPLTVDHSGLASHGITALKNNQITAVIPLLQSLLDRGDLQAAQAILQTASPANLQDPELNFLYGRFVWQAVKAGYGEFTVADAQLYWRTAQQKQPSTSRYLNALAFTYYQAGDWNTAKQLWLSVLPLEGKSENSLFTNGNPLGGRYPDTTPITTPEAVTASAGLALVFWHLGTLQPVGQQSQFFNQALQLHDRVLASRPDFTPDRLSQNWLWTPATLKEWQALGEAHP
jgi:tetratricopeptide (TPR) repeat protein